MEAHSDLYRLHDANPGYIYQFESGDRPAQLPMLHCDVCDQVSSYQGVYAADVDPDQLPPMTRLGPAETVGSEQFAEIVAVVRPYVPAWLSLRPGVKLGPWYGAVRRRPRDLMIGSGLAGGGVFLSPRLHERLLASDIVLSPAVPVEMTHESRSPKDLSGYVELEVAPGLLPLHPTSFAPVPRPIVPCGACGLEAPMAIQQCVVAPGANLPAGVALSRASNAFGVIFVSGAARRALISAGLEERLFVAVRLAPTG